MSVLIPGQHLPKGAQIPQSDVIANQIDHLFEQIDQLEVCPAADDASTAPSHKQNETNDECPEIVQTTGAATGFAALAQLSRRADALEAIHQALTEALDTVERV